MSIWLDAHLEISNASPEKHDHRIKLDWQLSLGNKGLDLHWEAI